MCPWRRKCPSNKSRGWHPRSRQPLPRKKRWKKKRRQWDTILKGALPESPNPHPNPHPDLKNWDIRDEESGAPGLSDRRRTCETTVLSLNMMDMLGVNTRASHPNSQLLQDLEGSALTQDHNKVCFARKKKKKFHLRTRSESLMDNVQALSHVLPLDTLTVGTEVHTVLVWADVRHTFIKKIFFSLLFIYLAVPPSL